MLPVKSHSTIARASIISLSFKLFLIQINFLSQFFFWFLTIFHQILIWLIVSLTILCVLFTPLKYG